MAETIDISKSLRLYKTCGVLRLYDFQSEYATEIKKDDCCKLAQLLLEYFNENELIFPLNLEDLSDPQNEEKLFIKEMEEIDEEFRHRKD